MAGLPLGGRVDVTGGDVVSAATVWSLVTGEARTGWLLLVPVVAGTVVEGGSVALDGVLSGAGETTVESVSLMGSRSLTV